MPSVALRALSPALAPFVESIHHHEGELPDVQERILPGGRVHLMVNLYEDEFRTYHGADCLTVHRTRGAVFAGPNSRATVIDTREQRRVVMVNFKLGGAAPFFHTPICEARDQLVDLDNLWGRDGRLLREQLLDGGKPDAILRVLDRVLVDHLVHAADLDPMIPLAACAFERGWSVSQTATWLGFLPKTFVRRFRKHVGLSPKRFARIRRLQRVLESISLADSVDWCDVAHRYGYADQAHFIHDFRELTGLTPAAYRPRSPAEYNHAPVSRA